MFGEGGAGLVDHVGEAEGFDGEVQFARFDLGEVENVVENAQLGLGSVADDVRLPIRLDPRGELVLGVEGGRASRFLIEGPLDARFYLRAGERYLGVDDTGRVRLRDRPSRIAPFSVLRLSPRDVVSDN